MGKISESTLIAIAPVIPSSDISRDVAWYKDKAGFDCVHSDTMYAVLSRANIGLHLQWHAGTIEDPLLGGSVVRIFVKNIKVLFDEFVDRGTVDRNKLRLNTPWGTHEFGFYDLNKNAIFVAEDIV